MNLFNNAMILKLNKMEMESLGPVKYVKNINKNKVALPRIESYLKKTGKEALINIVENSTTIFDFSGKKYKKLDQNI